MLGPGALNANAISFLDRTYFAVAEQFTHFGTVQVDGDEVANPSGQYENSSITQLIAGYKVSPTFGLQLNVPLSIAGFGARKVLRLSTEQNLASVIFRFSVISFFFIRNPGAAVG